MIRYWMFIMSVNRVLCGNYDPMDSDNHRDVYDSRQYLMLLVVFRVLLIRTHELVGSLRDVDDSIAS